MRIHLDKIASSTRNAQLPRFVVVGEEIPAKAGTVVACRILDEKSVYNQIEDEHGRMMTYHRGDVIAGVLGAREALRGYSGEIPESVKPGDILHLLNLGGVIGRCTSANPEVGPPARVEVLGGVMSFRELGRRVGTPASIFPGPVPFADKLDPGLPPLVLLVGSCMSAGKTQAACTLIRRAVERGIRVGACKVTGVALRRDSLEMRDHGAEVIATFADAGLPSTCHIDPLPIARGCINYVAQQQVGLLVVELGDGLLGEYGVKEILGALDLKAAVGAVVFAATDPVAAYGGAQLLREMGWEPTVVTGPATDNRSGKTSIRQRVGVEAANARTEGALLGDMVLRAVGLLGDEPTEAVPIHSAGGAA